MIYDLVIIGAGPAGLTAGIYARTKMMSTLILDAGVVGGQLVNLYPEKGIHNFPGFETIQARKLSDKLYAQAESMECEIHEMEKVIDLKQNGQNITVKTNKTEYVTKSVIISIGMGMFKPRRIGCKGETEFEGKGLSYIMPLKEDIVGKKIVVFGGGNSAIEMAMIAGKVADTTIVHRRTEFRANESNVSKLKNSRVKTIMETELQSVNGTDHITSVTLKQGNENIEIPTDLVVISIGISANLDDLKGWDIELTESGLIKVGSDMSTSRRGVYACGDVVDYPGKCKQIITGCGEAGTAVLSAHKFVKKPYWA